MLENELRKQQFLVYRDVDLGPPQGANPVVKKERELEGTKATGKPQAFILY